MFILQHITQYVIDCDKKDTAPNVNVVIAEYKFTLTGNDYIFKVSYVVLFACLYVVILPIYRCILHFARNKKFKRIFYIYL